MLLLTATAVHEYLQILHYLTSSNSSISSFELNNFFLISCTVFLGWNLNSVWLIHFELRLSLKMTTMKLFLVSCSVIWIICLICASWILQMFFASSIKIFRILFLTFFGFFLRSFFECARNYSINSNKSNVVHQRRTKAPGHP